MAAHPEWLTVAIGELGQAEVAGAGNNPRILEYHARTSLHASADAVPWCAAFVSWCLEQAGLPSAHSARARDYEAYGQPLSAPAPGCIVVLSRQGGGHVGFYMGRRDDRVLILGGNQGNRVSVAGFPASQVLAYRWPAEERRPQPETLAEAAQTGTGSAATQVAAAVAAAAPAAPLVTAFAGMPPWVAFALIVAAAAGAAAWVISNRRAKA